MLHVDLSRDSILTTSPLKTPLIGGYPVMSGGSIRLEGDTPNLDHPRPSTPCLLKRALTS
jgi:hypothetical protein